MLEIPCPWCGPRAEVEFTYGGAAGRQRPSPEAAAEAWADYVYLRDNPRGAHRELWHHVAGCRRWLVVERDTLTHAIAGVEPASGQADGR